MSEPADRPDEGFPVDDFDLLDDEDEKSLEEELEEEEEDEEVPQEAYPGDLAEEPVSGYRSPEEEGLPDYADDTTTAFEEADRPRFRDSPASLPSDRPQAVDEFGVTPAEQREGEPLEGRLAREVPDVVPEPPEEAGTEPTVDRGRLESDPGAGRLAEPDEGAATDLEKDLLAHPAGGEALSAEEEAVHRLPEGEEELPPDEIEPPANEISG